jgi:hypothetical protein
MNSDAVMNYVECDLDAAVTLPQWRRERAGAQFRRHHPVRRLRARLRGAVKP